MRSTGVLRHRPRSSVRSGMYEFRHIDELIHPAWVERPLLDDRDVLAASVEHAGIGPAAADAIVDHIITCASELGKSTSRSSALAGFVPGRIEVLGKHTDYAGGGSLICALQRGISFVAVPRSDGVVSARDARAGESVEVALSPEAANHPGHWSDYVVTVCRRLSRDFPELTRGADIAFSSNLPQASGMSSSSALTVAFALVLMQVNDLGSEDRFGALFERPEDLAQYLGAVENGLPFLTLDGDTGVGTFGGSEDHTAILCSQQGLMKWYFYVPVRFREALAIPEDHVFGVAFCGLHAAKSSAVLERYNYLSDSTAAIAASWRAAMDRDEPHLGAISAVPGYSRTEVALAIREFPADRYSVRELTDRLDHFHHENNLILPAAVEALEEHRLDRFGELVDRSQHLAETLLKNQTDETVYLARYAREMGAAAASAFGAGFGGSVWALVHEDQAPGFLDSWSSGYRERFPGATETATFFLDTPGPAAFRIVTA